jgi:hypothetical protein
MSIPLFRSLTAVTSNVIVPEQWPVLKAGVIQKCNSLANYYLNAKKVVSNTHPLIAFIQSVQVPIKLPLAIYFKYVEEACMVSASAAGFTTTSSAGRANNGFFYNSDNAEEIIAYKAWFDFEDVNRNWMTACAVKPLMIPQSDLGILYPIGKKYSQDAGITVIGLNPAMLMVKYRAFFLAQELKPVGQRESIQKFIGAYVLPWMMPLQVDLLLLNRIVNAWYGQRNGDSTVLEPHPYATTNYSNQIDQVIPKILETIKKIGTKSFVNILQNIPAFLEPTMYHVLILPDVMTNRQTDWLVTATRLKFYTWLCDVAGNKAATSNQMELGQFARQMALYDASVQMTKNLSPAHDIEAKLYLDKIYKYTNKV